MKTLILSSSFDELDRLKFFIEELKSWADLDDDDFDRIMLTLSEAVDNAMVHGNEQKTGKQVVINACLDREKRTLKISIRDEGTGFDLSSVPNPLKEENLMKEGGRGIFLIAQYADDYHYSKKGNQVTITYHIK